MITWLKHETESDWLATRKRFVTASEAAILAGKSTWTSAYALWHEKKGLIDHTPINEERNFWGHVDEDSLLKWLRLRAQIETWRPGPYDIATNPDYPSLSCTPDALTTDGVPRQGHPVQCKLREFQSWADGVPDEVTAQLQVEMACTESDFAYVVTRTALYKAQWFRIERHQPFIDAISAAATRFMESIAEGVPPLVDGHESTTECLKKLHPKDNGERITLPAWAKEVDEEVEALKRLIKASEAQKEELQNRLREALGAATFGVGPDFELSYKHQTKAAHMVAASESRVLRRKSTNKEKKNAKANEF